MTHYLKLATQIALVTGTVCMAASCSTTSRVYTVVPAQKPSAEEIAQIEQLQQVDTTALASTETTPLNLQPVDMATDKTVAMAYAIPQPKPVNGASAALQQAVQVASADPVAAQEAMANSLNTDTASGLRTDTSSDVTNDAASGLKTRSLGPVVMQDGFDQPEISSANALVEEKPAEKSTEPFVSSTKNTNLNQLIAKYAALYDVPESLVHHVVRRETNYNPAAVHRGNWGLMQIRYNTARGLGYDGTPNGLLDAETNLKYAVKYLKGAWIVADKDATKADWLYRTGYYYTAKKKQLLEKLNMQ
jgi:soluble lytic murein transglycosylase-like protein